ncbi:MAG: RNA polymerase sigma-70 factor [Salinivirgaceae bacterium]
MTNESNNVDYALVVRLRNNDKSAFTLIFSKYYKNLVTFSFSYTKSLNASEEIVQDIFLKLWENRAVIIIQTSFKSYLLKSVQNHSLDWLRHQKIKTNHAAIILEHPILSDNDTEKYILYTELQEMLNKALTKIPEPYTQAFKMNRFEAMNYQEIAEKLEVSVRTVEVRISKALLLLKNELKDFLMMILAFITFN